MKAFLIRHLTALTVTAAVLFLSVCSLCTFIYMDFRADDDVLQRQSYLQETLFRTNVRRLEAALNEENTISSYHFALTAAENAAAAGYGDDASFFRKISTGIADGAQNISEIASAVNGYLETGEFPEGFTVLYHTEDAAENFMDSEPASVSAFRVRAAEECAAEVTGADGILRPAEKTRPGEFIYTCRNAYAVIDARSGMPVEAGVSLRPGETRLTEADCVGYAENFLNDYFPPDIARAAVLVSAVPDPQSGTFDLTYRSNDREIRLSVKRDSGRVVRLIAR